MIIKQNQLNFQGISYISGKLVPMIIFYSTLRSNEKNKMLTLD